MIVWVIAESFYKEKCRREAESNFELFDAGMESAIERFVRKMENYDDVLEEVKAALADTELWANYEPSWRDVISNTADWHFVLDVMLANRSKIRAKAVLTGYKANGIDDEKMREFLLTLQATLRYWKVSRPLLAIRDKNSGSIVRYAWSGTPAADCGSSEERVELNCAQR